VTQGPTDSEYARGIAAIGHARIPIPMAFHSFGGWKRSLFGEMAVHGMEGARFYIPLRTLTARWPTGIRAGAEYVMPTMR
jgi:malonate-semialdehyde dehydrogenase (acetylating) / methylmalonate-semialdehyde dehydrogenase